MERVICEIMMDNYLNGLDNYVFFKVMILDFCIVS